MNPTLPLPDTEIAARLRLAVMRLARRLRQEAPAGVTPSQLSVLAILEIHGPMTLGRVAEVERVKPPTMSKIVAALEEEGLVGRRADKEDKRRTELLLTAKGRRLVEGSRTRKTAYLAERVRKLPTEDVEALIRASEIIEEMLEDPR